MLRRPAKVEPEPPKREPFTYVHRGTTFVGELRAEGRVRVHGTLRGTVKVRGVLEVAESGVVEGELIEAEDVKVLGRVVADVRASGKVEIWKGGQIVGDVSARALDIEEGALFTGRSEMVGEDGKSLVLSRDETRGRGALPAPAAEGRDAGPDDEGGQAAAEPVVDALAAWAQDAADARDAEE